MSDKKLLFVNACVNKSASRTLRIASRLLELLKESYVIEELDLEHLDIHPLDSQRLNERLALLARGELLDPSFILARQFANANCVVVAAPYWDFGFPAMLKVYIENISVTGISYRYGERGQTVGLCKAERLKDYVFDEVILPRGQTVGLCKAERLYYVTTRGGLVTDEDDLGYRTLEGMGHIYGIKDIRCMSARGLDIVTVDADAEVSRAIDEKVNAPGALT